MPIHERGYRRREARRPLPRLRALLIARQAAGQILSRRALLLFVALSLSPFVVAASALLLLSRVPELASALPPYPALAGRYLGLQTLFAILLTVWGGTGLMADDLRSGALVVYLSRPITRLDYVAGKLLVVVALNLCVTAVPTLALWALAVALDPRDLSGRGLAFLPLAIVLQALLSSLVLSLLAMGAAAATGNAPLAGALFIGLLVVLDAAILVTPAPGRALLRLLSVRADLGATSDALFGVSNAAGVHWAAALACLFLAMAAAAVVVWRRVVAVETVA